MSLIDEIAQTLIPIIVVVAVCIVMIAALMLPIVWFDGHAKSKWIEQTQGVSIPWHEAAFLKVEITSSDVSIRGGNTNRSERND